MTADDKGKGVAVGGESAASGEVHFVKLVWPKNVGGTANALQCYLDSGTPESERTLKISKMFFAGEEGKHRKVFFLEVEGNAEMVENRLRVKDDDIMSAVTSGMGFLRLVAPDEHTDAGKRKKQQSAGSQCGGGCTAALRKRRPPPDPNTFIPIFSSKNNGAIGTRKGYYSSRLLNGFPMALGNVKPRIVAYCDGSVMTWELHKPGTTCDIFIVGGGIGVHFPGGEFPDISVAAIFRNNNHVELEACILVMRIVRNGFVVEEWGDSEYAPVHIMSYFGSRHPKKHLLVAESEELLQSKANAGLLIHHVDAHATGEARSYANGRADLLAAHARDKELNRQAKVFTRLGWTILQKHGNPPSCTTTPLTSTEIGQRRGRQDVYLTSRLGFAPTTTTAIPGTVPTPQQLTQKSLPLPPVSTPQSSSSASSSKQQPHTTQQQARHQSTSSTSNVDSQTPRLPPIQTPQQQHPLQNGKKRRTNWRRFPKPEQ
ncbi:hypothetical protein HK097_002449 [Rhizophlyctis rosea]|uniref:Uncharacterized protein n=1 Tax=Rhizophlyctis rosea TaxID=64517 RepID=A0AAD5S5Z3_9FUNG|nr:hypothetical protein HK097_002449 [Rhizophlyctis rosea]